MPDTIRLLQLGEPGACADPDVFSRAELHS